MKNNLSASDEFGKAVLDGTATWWNMELPSGKVVFGDAKADMLGYPETKFNYYTDFTGLLHKDDHEKAMQAMRNHLEGKDKFYEAVYRIQHKDGHYIKFYDCGQIIEKNKDNIVLAGFVMRVKEDENISEQMDEFKKLILENKPSMIDLVKKIKVL